MKRDEDRARELVLTWFEDFDISNEEQRFNGLIVRVAAALAEREKEARVEERKRCAEIARRKNDDDIAAEIERAEEVYPRFF